MKVVTDVVVAVAVAGMTIVTVIETKETATEIVTATVTMIAPATMETEVAIEIENEKLNLVVIERKKCLHEKTLMEMVIEKRDQRKIEHGCYFYWFYSIFFFCVGEGCFDGFC